VTVQGRNDSLTRNTPLEVVMSQAVRNVAAVPTPKNPSVQSATKTATPDLLLENHFSLYLIRPVSPAGQNFLDENVGDENTLTFGGAIVCEPRYIEAIWRGAIDGGLVCR
jgi:hypothetical protein